MLPHTRRLAGGRAGPGRGWPGFPYPWRPGVPGVSGVAVAQVLCGLRMRSGWLWLLALELLCASRQVAAAAGPGATLSGPLEICQWGKETVDCGGDAVISLQSALYGRMRAGRCLTNEFGHLGCQVDVLPYLDSRCSGRHSCQLSLPDQYMDALPRPCSRQLATYLEVEAQCVPIQTGDRQSCSQGNGITVQGSHGYLSSTVTERSGFGSTTCPWVIRASPGQSVTLTLVDFSYFNASRAGPEYCRIYGKIREPDSMVRSGRTLCGSASRREWSYESTTSEVHLELERVGRAGVTPHFLVKYEVTGCADVPVSGGAEVSRADDVTVVRCGDEEWRMRCEEGRWVGRVANCTTGGAVVGQQTWLQMLSLPQSALIIFIIGVAILIAVIILVIGIVSIRRRQKREARELQASIEHDKYLRQVSYSLQKDNYPMLVKHDSRRVQRESDYTTTLHRRLAVPPGAILPPLDDAAGIMGHLECPCPVHGQGGCLPPGVTPGLALAAATPSGVTPGVTTTLSSERATPSMSTFRPHVEHIYESPKFNRKEYKTEDGLPFYHVLDPEQVPRHAATPPQSRDVAMATPAAMAERT